METEAKISALHHGAQWKKKVENQRRIMIVINATRFTKTNNFNVKNSLRNRLEEIAMAALVVIMLVLP